MKKIQLLTLLSVFTLLIYANELYGQRAYMSLNAGHSMKMSSGNLPFFGFVNSSATPYTYSEEQINISLGKGTNIDAAFGYMFSKHLSMELGASYLFGGKYEAEDYYQTNTTNFTISARMIRIIPSMKVSAGLKGVNPYAKLGLVIGFGSVNLEVDEYYNVERYYQKIKFNGGTAIGLNAALGASFPLNDDLSLFSEISMMNMSYAPVKGEILEARHNGVDKVPDFTTSEKEIEFVDSYERNVNSPPSEDEPSKVLKQKLPFGSVGLNVGLRIAF